MRNGLYAKFCTSRGEIIADLKYEKTPTTVANFVGLAEGTIKNTAKGPGEPYYDGSKFHRVIDNFMIQSGDPTGTGAGGPGYQFEDEINPELKHDRSGTLSMANTGPNTNGSQFFITHKATPWLDGKHSVFGNVIEGLNIVGSVKQGDTIDKVKIIRTGPEARKFDAYKIFSESMNLILKKDIKAIEEFTKEMKTLTKGFEKTESGLYYKIHQGGNGQKPKKRQAVSVHYTGKLTNGNKFDSSYDRNQPLEFSIGVGHVIQGWDEGILLLSVGAKATFIIPANLGYGNRGAGGAIPPNATLIFDVELVDIK